MEVAGQCHALATLPQERGPVPIVQEAGWALVLVWMDTENFTSTKVQILNPPACSGSLYQHVKYRMEYAYLHLSQLCRQMSLFQFGDANMSLS
jgi:hypothetical protein